MKPSILIVDDEQEIVQALTRLLMKRFDVHGFSDPKEALAYFSKSPTHVVLSDMRMPEVTGVEVMEHVYKVSPKSRRIVLTGYADIEMAQNAINKGHVHAYLGKPWDNDELLSTLERLIIELKQENRSASVVRKLKKKNQYLKDKSEANELLNNVILSSSDQAQQQNDRLIDSHNDLISLSANLIASHTQDVIGHATRVAQHAKVLAMRVSLQSELITALYLSGLFYRIALTEKDVNLSKQPFNELKPQQQHIWQKLPLLSSEILAETPMFAISAKIIENSYFVWGSEFCQIEDIHIHEKEPTAFVIAAKILSLVIFVDLYMSGQIDGKTHLLLPAFRELEGPAKKYFGHQLVAELQSMLRQPLSDESYELPKTVTELHEGDVLAQDVYDKLDHCMLTQNTVLTEPHITSLKSLQEESGGQLLFYVQSIAPSIDNG